jgi:two-component system cell cycle response regulator DivK
LEEVKPDIILTDNWIPDAGGIVTTMVIKRKIPYQDIPDIYISSNPDIKILANEAGADACLMKPFCVNALIEMCDSLMN